MANAVEQFATRIAVHRRLGDSRLRELLLREFGDASKGKLDSAAFGAVVTARDRRLAEQLIARGVRIVSLGDANYPDRLATELGEQAPPVLYVLGDPALLQQKCVAIIGTRRPSIVGRDAARLYAGHLAARGIAVVSGNAPGVDSAAHEAVLAAGGTTIVFPPVPMEQFNPGFTCAGCEQRMLVASPFVPGIEVQPWCFLRRNSLVAALCETALVAETGTRGGTLDTVRKLRALERTTCVTRLPSDTKRSDAKRSNAHQLLVASGAQWVPATPDDVAMQLLLSGRGRRAKVLAHADCLFGGGND